MSMPVCFNIFTLNEIEETQRKLKLDCSALVNLSPCAIS